MPVRKKKEKQPDTMVVMRRARISFVVKGIRPLIINRLAEKAQQSLLIPPKRKSRTDKEVTLKHNPLEEFRNSVHRTRSRDSETLLMAPGAWFKHNISCVALDLEDSPSKAQLSRLVWVVEDEVPIYGIPQLRMDWARQKSSGGGPGAPDIRTRACLAEWVALFTVDYAVPALTQRTIEVLVANAGQLQGVGDWRSQKGGGNHGAYEIATLDDADVKRIMKTGGRKAQEDALRSPAFWNAEAEELFSHFETELERRGRAIDNGAEVVTR